MTLEYLERKLTKSEKRQVARYMSQYENMDAIIKARTVSLVSSKVSSIKEDPVQETNTNSSEQDKVLLKMDDLIMAKKRLDMVYTRVKPLHKLIWDEHFIGGIPDFQIYYDPANDVTKKRYYQEKNELMNVVAECLGIGTNKHHESTT